MAKLFTYIADLNRGGGTKPPDDTMDIMNKKFKIHVYEILSVFSGLVYILRDLNIYESVGYGVHFSIRCWKLIHNTCVCVTW